MHARVQIHTERLWLERGLAAIAAAWLIYVLLNFNPHDLGGLAFPLSIGLGVWPPRLARSRSSAVGEVRCDADGLVVPEGWRRRRIPWPRVVGVSVAPAARGASLLVCSRRGEVVAAEHLEDVQRVARGILRCAPATEVVSVPVRRLGWLAAALRPATSLLALGYYLHVHLDVVGGDKTEYGLAALFAGIVLFLIHMLGPRDLPIREAAASDAFSRALRAHLALHARAPAAADRARRPRACEEDQSPVEWLRQMRRELGSPGPYRDVAQGKEAQLEQTLQSGDAPLRERALALRVLSSGRREEVRRRIATADHLEAGEAAWAEKVALAEDDDDAVAIVARRAPDFVA